MNEHNIIYVSESSKGCADLLKLIQKNLESMRGKLWWQNNKCSAVSPLISGDLLR